MQKRNSFACDELAPYRVCHLSGLPDRKWAVPAYGIILTPRCKEKLPHPISGFPAEILVPEKFA